MMLLKRKIKGDRSLLVRRLLGSFRRVYPRCFLFEQARLYVNGSMSCSFIHLIMRTAFSPPPSSQNIINVYNPCIRRAIEKVRDYRSTKLLGRRAVAQIPPHHLPTRVSGGICIKESVAAPRWGIRNSQVIRSDYMMMKTHRSDHSVSM
jgi:hypothetical protein